MLERIRVNTQSSIRIETGEGKVIYCDPFKIEETAKDADLIFFTHDHFDHFSPEDVAKVAKEETIYVCPAAMVEDVKAVGIAEEQITTVLPETKVTIADIPVEAVPAYNTKKPFHPKEKGWVGYVLAVDGKRIYIAGDTNFIPEQKELSCDIAMVPIGGYYTMDAREAAYCINTMCPKTVIPTHYGSIVGHRDQGELFKKMVRNEIEVVLKLFQ